MKSETLKSDRSSRGRVPGVYVAGTTAAISGVSVFVNSYGVRAVPSPVVYTTAKNVVAALVLAAAAAIGLMARARETSIAANFVAIDQRGLLRSATLWRGWSRMLALAYVGIIGGGLAFILFFKGLAVAQPASAAFWHDTLVVWVALFALVMLREHVKWWNIVAMLLLVVGEVTVTGGVGQLGAHRGEALVLIATVLWAIEVVVAKRLLREFSPATVSLVRMGVGSLALVIYVAGSGALSGVLALTAHQLLWVLGTGLLLAAYVATWMTALARSRALDVTSVLVASALVTWLLQEGVGTAPVVASLGLILIALGVGLVMVASVRRGVSAPPMERT